MDGGKTNFDPRQLKFLFFSSFSRAAIISLKLFYQDIYEAFWTLYWKWKKVGWRICFAIYRIIQSKNQTTTNVTLSKYEKTKFVNHMNATWLDNISMGVFGILTMICFCVFIITLRSFFLFLFYSNKSVVMIMNVLEILI